MATRSRSTFKKRQKEIARMEKQRDKAAKRMERKLQKQTPGSGQDDDIAWEDAFVPDSLEDSSDPR
jgi:hypothetical protein